MFGKKDIREQLSETRKNYSKANNRVRKNVIYAPKQLNTLNFTSNFGNTIGSGSFQRTVSQSHRLRQTVSGNSPHG